MMGKTIQVPSDVDLCTEALEKLKVAVRRSLKEISDTLEQKYKIVDSFTVTAGICGPNTDESLGKYFFYVLDEQSNLLYAEASKIGGKIPIGDIQKALSKVDKRVKVSEMQMGKEMRTNKGIYGSCYYVTCGVYFK